MDRVKPREAAAAAMGPRRREMSGGIRGCVRSYLFAHMLDAVPGSFKILICDAPASAMLNSCARVHELMEHGVTLLENLMEPRQPIITSPVLYFFDPNDASVERIIQDWHAKDPYKEVHIFSLSTTPERYIHQLARARISPKVMSFKDMMLNFFAPEVLVFHLNMQNEFFPLMSPAPPPTRESVLEAAVLRLLSVFHVINNGVPVIRYQGGSDVCQRFAKMLHENLARHCFDVPEFMKGDGGSDSKSPILVILDRSFDTVTPLMHHRTYQCLLEDLLPLEDNLYVQTYRNRSGVESTRQQPLDEEDPYWCFYRHRFFSNCLEELPAALKKLLQENPTLVQGTEQKWSVTDLGNAVRALPEFQERQGRLSMHIDICTKIMTLYRECRLSEICEVEQDIAAERKPFKLNLENVGRLAADVTIPEQVRLRLMLLLVATSNTGEFSEAKKQRLIRDSGLTAHVDRFENLARVTSRVGRLVLGGNNLERGRRGDGGAVTDGAAEGDPFVTQAYLIVEALTKDALSTVDYPFAGGHPGGLGAEAATASGGGGFPGASTANKTLRTGLALAALGRKGGPWAAGSHDLVGGGGGGADAAAAATEGAALRAAGRGGDLLDLGGGEGVVSLSSKRRIVVFVLGGLTFGEMCAAYEASKRFGREVIVGGTSLLRPNAFVQELGKLR